MSGTHKGRSDPARVRGAEPEGLPGDSRAPEPVWVDAHVHIFPPEMIARAGVLPPSRRPLCRSVRRLRGRGWRRPRKWSPRWTRPGWRRPIVFGFPFRDQGLCRMVNDYVLEAVAAWPGRLAGLACVSPREPGAAAELERCLDAGMRGCGELAPAGTSEDLDRAGGSGGRAPRERELAAAAALQRAGGARVSWARAPSVPRRASPAPPPIPG